jgi:hypothetical protein
VIPEAIGRNQLVLPKGAECDACNQYAGKRLESNLIRYPEIALAVQFLGTPGKSGKSRAEIGGLTRERLDPNTVRVKGKILGRVEAGTDGRLRVVGRVPATKDFDFRRFRRGLYHMGLNMVAAQLGIERALEARFDSVRRYVRNPKPANESWPYGQIYSPEKGFQRLLAGQFIQVGEVEFAAIRVSHVTFLLDLERSGELEKAAHWMGGVFVPGDWELPPPTRVEVGPGE